MYMHKPEVMLLPKQLMCDQVVPLSWAKTNKVNITLPSMVLIGFVSERQKLIVNWYLYNINIHTTHQVLIMTCTTLVLPLYQ